MASEIITITQEGDNVYIDGLAGFGETALAGSTSYRHVAPIKGTIDRETGGVKVQSGQAIAEILEGDLAGWYVIVFPTYNPNQFLAGNAVHQWFHIDGDRLVWDMHLTMKPAEGAFGSGVQFSSSTLSAMYYGEMRRTNGVLSYTQTVDEVEVSRQSPVWYGFSTADDGTETMTLSNVMLERSRGFVTEWTVADGLATAENQNCWWAGGEYYKLASRTVRGQIPTTVVADVSNRQHIVWPQKIGNDRVTNWLIKNTTTNETLGLCGTAEICGPLWGTFSTLYVLHDGNGWDPSQPDEVEPDENGVYTFTLSEGCEAFRVSTTKGTSILDIAGFDEGSMTVEAATLSPRTVYPILTGTADMILPEYAGAFTVTIDLTDATLMISSPDDAIVVNFDNSSAHWASPLAHYSLDNAESWEEPVAMTRKSAGAVVARDLDLDSAEVWSAEIPADATHVKFSDGLGHETRVFEAAPDQLYEDSQVSSIAVIEATQPTAGCRYYNLQGVAVSSPVAGSVYISVCDGKASKIILK